MLPGMTSGVAIEPDALVQALRARLAAEHGEARLVETHISWVLLAGPHAYKLKKPVRFGFLDFSSAAARRRFCEAELRLNQRLAPQLYRAVLDVRMDAQGPSLGGRGEVVDSALWMHRMPDDALASVRLAEGRLTREHLQRLGRRLSAFHRAAPVADAASPWGRPERVRDDLLLAFDALLPRLAPADAAVCATLRADLDAGARALAPRIEARRRAGCVRECHGDLHLDNIVVLGEDVTAFDCIEFDDGLRWIDTASDIGFAWMDLLAHGRADLAQALLDAWLEDGGDFDSLALLRFFGAYRAVVRALVSALRTPGQRPGSGLGSPAYLALAGQLTRPPRAALAITHGLPGSGKSWLAERLLEPALAVRMRSDVERQRLARAQLAGVSRCEVDRYSEDATAATYSRLLTLADAALRDGWPVILDAAWLRREQRSAAQDLAARHGVALTILDCRAPMPLLRRRVRVRLQQGGDPSEADEAVLERLASCAEPLSAAEHKLALTVSTDEAIDAAALAARWLARGAGP